MILIRRLTVLVLVPIVFGYVVGTVLMACSLLTESQQKQIHDDSSQILICQIRGLNCRDLTDAGVPGGDAGCYAVYDECMRDGGLRP